LWDWCIRQADNSLKSEEQDLETIKVPPEEQLRKHYFEEAPSNRCKSNKRVMGGGGVDLKAHPDVILEKEKFCATWMFRHRCTANSAWELQIFVPFVILLVAYFLMSGNTEKLAMVQSMRGTLVDTPIAAASYGGVKTTLSNIRTTKDIYHWLQGPLVDTVWFAYSKWTPQIPYAETREQNTYTFSSLYEAPFCPKTTDPLCPTCVSPQSPTYTEWMCLKAGCKARQASSCTGSHGTLIQHVQNKNILLGGVRLRQQRVKSGLSCGNRLDLQQMVSGSTGGDIYDGINGSKCFPTYKAESTRETGDYLDPTGTNRWVYTEGASADFQDSNDYQSFYNYIPAVSTWTEEEYPSGGYMVHVDIGDRDNATSTMKVLEDKTWLDQQTRALFVEFTSYSPDTSLFLMTQIMFELSPLGTIYVTPKFRATKLYRYNLNKADDIGRLVLEVLLLLFIVYFIYEKVKLIHREGWKYALRFLNSPQVLQDYPKGVFKEVFQELQVNMAAEATLGGVPIKIPADEICLIRVRRRDLYDRLIDAYDIKAHIGLDTSPYNGSPSYITIFTWSLRKSIKETISWEEFKNYLATTPQQEGFGGANAFESPFWEALDIANLALFAYSIYMRVHWHNSRQIQGYDLDKAVTTFFDLTGPASYVEYQEDLIGTNALLTSLKFLKYFQTERAINAVWQTVCTSGKYMLYFFVIFFVILIMFIFAGITVFGSHLRDFSSFGYALTTLLSIILGKFDYMAIKRVSPELSMWYFLLFVFILYLVLINMILAIIGSSYRQTMHDQVTRGGVILQAISRERRTLWRKHKEYLTSIAFQESMKKMDLDYEEVRRKKVAGLSPRRSN